MRILGRRAAKMLELESARAEELTELELVADADTLRRLGQFPIDQQLANPLKVRLRERDCAH